MQNTYVKYDLKEWIGPDNESLCQLVYLYTKP